MHTLLPGGVRGRPYAAARRQQAWLAAWLQGRRRGRRPVLLPAPLLVPTWPSLATWEWAYANPTRWNAYKSLDGGVTWLFDDFVNGDARQYAPDGGSHYMFIVGVDANGNEITERSNAVRPDDALPPTLFDDLEGYWDGDAATDATGLQLLSQVASPTFGSGGGPNGGPSCALASADFVYSDDDVFFNFDAMTMNAWVKHNQSNGMGFLSARTANGNYASYYLFIALDAQVGTVGHFHSTSQGESTPYDYGSAFGVSAGQWYMQTVVITATEVKYYINGVLRASLNKSFSTTRLAGVSFRVKDNHPWGTWTGAWANLGVWSRGLSADDVAALYNDGQGKQYNELL